MDLKETAAAAKAEGMTYGEYVTKYGPQVDVKIPAGLETQKEKTPPKPPEPAPQEEPEGIAVEMIDCIIRILDWLGKEGLDVDGILARKHEYNKGRPYLHGGKKL